MNIVFMGSGNFALIQLKALLNSPKIQVIEVVTQPKKEFGRDKKLQPTLVGDFMSKFHADIKLVEAKNSMQIKKNIDLSEADFVVVADYGVILRDYILDAPKIDCINVHGSILPKYRGASPIQTCLLNGDKITGVTIMRMAEAMDAGDVYKIVEYEIQEEDVAPILYEKLANIGAEALLDVLFDIYENSLEPVAQDESLVSFCGKIDKKDGLISFKQESAMEIWNKYRAYYFWPKIYFERNGKKFIIHQCRALVDEVLSNEFLYESGELFLQTKQGVLAVSKLQMEGKKVMNAQDFWNGQSEIFQK